MKAPRTSAREEWGGCQLAYTRAEQKQVHQRQEPEEAKQQPRRRRLGYYLHLRHQLAKISAEDSKGWRCCKCQWPVLGRREASPAEDRAGTTSVVSQQHHWHLNYRSSMSRRNSPKKQARLTQIYKKKAPKTCLKRVHGCKSELLHSLLSRGGVVLPVCPWRAVAHSRPHARSIGTLVACS